MQKPEIVVSYALDAAKREILEKELADGSNLKFLSDVSAGERAGVLASAEAIIAWNPQKELSPEEFGLLSRLKLVQLISAGAEHVPFAMVPPQAMIASNPGAFAEPMAEHILGMALALAKRLCVNHRKLAGGEFDMKTKNRWLRGMTLGVLGFGGIGQAAARLMRAVGVRIFALNTSGKTNEPVDFVGTLDDLDHVLRNCDILLVSIPLTKQTRGLIEAKKLAAMKPDAILVNVARGGIIDEGALYRHLVENPAFSAAIDTWWIEPSMGGEFKVNYPFFDLPNFLGSPHNSSAVPGIMSTAVKLVGENVARFVRGEKIKGIVIREEYINA